MVFALFAAWLISASTLSDSVASQPALMSLNEALQFALDHSPSVDSARRSQDIGGLTKQSAFGRFLPSLDFATTNGLQGANPQSSDDPWTSQLSLTLSENLYDNGLTLTQYHVADLGKDLSDLSYFKARDQLCLNVTLQFYRYSLAVKLLAVTRQQQKLLKTQFDTMADQYKQGVKTRQDYLRFKAQLQRIEINLVAADHDSNTAEVELSRLLGSPVGQPSRFGFAAIEPGSLNVDFPAAPPPLERSYDFRLSRLQESIDSLNEDLIKRKYWPQVFLTGSSSYQYSNYLGNSQLLAMNSNQFSWSAQLAVQYNLWDWGIRGHDVQIAEATRLISRDTQEQNVISTRAAVETVMEDMKQLKANYEMTQELLDLSQESFDFLNQQYRVGKVGYIDIITGLSDLLDAKVQFYTSYFQVLESLAQFHFYEGTLYDFYILTKK